MQLPTVINDLSPWTIGAAGVILIGGYLTHELMHIIPLKLVGLDVEVTFNPKNDPLWYALAWGETVEFESEAGAVINIVSVLAPGLLTIPAIVLWFRFLHSDYVSASLALVVATWFIVFLPSLADWLEAKEQLQHLYAGSATST